MKKVFFYRLEFFILILFLSLFNLKCKKESTKIFCQVNRSIFSSINNQEALVVYYTKYKRWAIYSKVNIPNNIDTKIGGLTCAIPSEFQVDGLNVIISGNFKKFNKDENITSQIGGEELYYFEITKIIKQ